jgi:hypothetical protein
LRVPLSGLARQLSRSNASDGTWLDRPHLVGARPVALPRAAGRLALQKHEKEPQ